MGILNAIRGTLLYLDTNVFIYALEGYLAYVEELTVLFSSIDQRTLQAVTSHLTLAETLVQPFMTDDRARQALYEQAIRPSRVMKKSATGQNRPAAGLRSDSKSALRTPRNRCPGTFSSP